ncbi:tRNA (adenosine(37)-N6)-threonylcarbamoyltransferase complex dimerization subunit type 1 TsaB [Paenactinomyces guangxiensis]|uniref:tRNA (Adenosine(37)-N6)-threonylcarbamoyltransferase complex dimerization subunit type 1 TsaB n=1 Tax=Paenactinomyces guangxiensis TaxID=1490290 RepID=A0A7W2AA46_9BACL|nr:tRNA (adenosine(37)-N6)-threonylcarbamoyltransferase complex dimerization subunit type 1 TsaB [Paenactinomyces guangxiensis]MBA4495573.1 tRNA (adenosine(37)-N6)-threonylcarbamoyltransferase complex dimerization subunit type 1 TsaB [Paenactinomyces guangxiensis]MBH8592831.1 tRNA (adenosine(37)-N6)-threonylcarbamoyltransferase complex dimerization subunit type 1 TsaB [Paenactinomyces guangxiensis]
MKMLTMDTSTLVMGIAVLDLEEKRVLGEVTTNLHKNHSVRLMPTVDQLLRDLDLAMSEIGVLAVTAGPGSYTGIRIGVTTAKTISWACGIPLYSESSLTVLAMNGYHFDGVVVPLFDARRRRVYSGVFQRDGEKMSEVVPQQVVEIESWLKQIGELRRPVLFLGDDVARFQDVIAGSLGDAAHFGSPAENIPRASQLGILAWHKWINDEPPEHADFAPNYLQMTEAEANWLKKQGNGETSNGEKG